MEVLYLSAVEMLTASYVPLNINSLTLLSTLLGPPNPSLPKPYTPHGLEFRV
jgi:hypothetical protein